MPGPGAPDFNLNDTDGEALRKLWGWGTAAPVHPRPARPEEAVFESLLADTSTKPTNPKDAVAFDKAPLHLVPASFKTYTAMALAEGAMKYGAWNWRAAGVRASVYVAALQRHVDKWFNGEEIDPETGVPHLANACACLAVLIDSKTQMNMTDDRPPRQLGLPKLVNTDTPEVIARLRRVFGDKKPKHWTIKEGDASEEHY